MAGSRHQRQAVKPLHRGNAFKRALHAFHGCKDEAFAIEHRTDVRGRRRAVGVAARAHALSVLFALMALQGGRRYKNGKRSAVVFISWAELGRRFERSRSTAYRACVALERAHMIVATERGGGKRIDENDQVTNRANGYELHPDLVAPEERQPRRRRDGRSTGQPLGRQGAQAAAMGADYADRWKDQARAARAGPGP